MVLSFFAFRSWIGVPVNPKINAFLNVFFISTSISPNVERWHSSMIITIRLRWIIFKSASILATSSLAILLNFWIDVTIKVLSESGLFNFDIKTSVFSVAWTDSVPVANERYSLSDCIPNSFLSTRKTTLSASWLAATSWAALKLVMVLPLPVVCHTWPPSCFLSSQWLFFSATILAIPTAA